MTAPSPRDAGLCGMYDLVYPTGAVGMAVGALNAYGIRTGNSPEEVAAAQGVLVVHVVPPGGAVPSDAELEGELAALSARHPGVSFELALAVSRQGMATREWSRVAPGIARVETDFHVKETMPGEALLGHDPRSLTAAFAGIRTRRSPTVFGCGDVADLLGKSVSGGWHRKGNVRIWGDLRLLRFKVRRDAAKDAPLHGSETALKTLRFGRTVWMLVRQSGPLEILQMPSASQSNALMHARWALRRAVHPVALFFWALTVRRRRFSHFLLLGYNCEMAYRFLMANGFLDSTLFAWAACWGPDIMMDALSRFDDICAGELAFAGATDLFIDVETGVFTHSRLKVDPSSPSGTADAEASKAELRSRMAHLREKFLRQLRDDEPTLAVVKISPSELRAADEYVRSLVDWLRRMGGRNFRMLAVCQKADAWAFPESHPDYELRTVSAYNPDWCPATELQGDRLGWTKIWREFAPARRIVQDKEYKFQKGGRR